jgi:uncharacterized protein (DUF3084 family)
MTTKNDSLSSIQVRIDELHNTISEKEEQIKARTSNLKAQLEMELSPLELVKRHPLKAVGTTFLAGFVLARALKRGQNCCETTDHTIRVTEDSCLSQNRTALASIGIDILRSAKDLGFTYLQRYIDQKIK